MSIRWPFAPEPIMVHVLLCELHTYRAVYTHAHPHIHTYTHKYKHIYKHTHIHIGRVIGQSPLGKHAALALLPPRPLVVIRV